MGEIMNLTLSSCYRTDTQKVPWYRMSSKQSVDLRLALLCIGVRKDVIGDHSLARKLMKWGTVPNALQDPNNANKDLSITYVPGFQSRVMWHALCVAEHQDVFNSFSSDFRKLLHLLSFMKKFYIYIHFFFSILSLDESEGWLLKLHW